MDDVKERRRRLAVLAGAVAVMLILLFVAYLILQKVSPEEKPTAPELDYEFYEPDWSLTYEDVISEEAYIDVGWYMTYTNDRGESVAILDDDYLNKGGIGVELLSYYFAAIQSGDAKTYNALFGEEYLNEHGPHPDFTPQRIYDIRVRLCRTEKPDEDTDVFVYETAYKIMKNDGTFTRLIGSDMSRAQYITVVSGKDLPYISDVETNYKG